MAISNIINEKIEPTCKPTFFNLLNIKVLDSPFMYPFIYSNKEEIWLIKGCLG